MDEDWILCLVHTCPNFRSGLGVDVYFRGRVSGMVLLALYPEYLRTGVPRNSFWGLESISLVSKYPTRTGSIHPRCGCVL